MQGVQWRLDPVRWEVVYPVHVDPIGEIWLDGDGFWARLHQEELGCFGSGDAAVEQVWRRFLDQAAVDHAAASVTHGGANRHVRRTASSG